MNVLNIMRKEIKQKLRDKKAMCMMVLFPIVLILILGAALGKDFGDDDGSFTVDAKVIYSMDNNLTLNNALKSFMDQVGKEVKITFDETKDINKGLESIEDSKYTCYVRVTDKDIKIYKNDRFGAKASLVESILNTFVDRMNAISEIGKVNPMAIQGILKDTKNDYTKAVSFEKKRTPRAKDYYAITMVTLIILYGSATGTYAIILEKVRNTKQRLLTTPVKKHELFLGKTLGCVLVTTFQIAIVVLISKYVLNTYWGENIWIVLLILLSEICVSISIGIGVALLASNEATGNGIINVAIPFMAFLGGNYFPLDNMGSKAMETISKISPLKWTNQSIFKVIYSNDFSLVGTALIINIGIVIVFMAMASIKFGKEEI